MSSAPADGATPDAVAVLREAGQEAAHRAPESAARWYADALRLLRDDAPAGDRVELLLARAGALATCGHFAESHAALLESYRLAPADAVALRIRLTTACAKIEHLLGLHEAAHQRLTDELAGLGDPASPEAVALMLELAVDGVYTLRFPQIAATRRAGPRDRPTPGRPTADRHHGRRAGMGHGTVRARPRGGEVPRRGGRPGR